MIDSDKVEQAFLSTATEDYYGLYEAIWELNGMYPNEGLGDKYKAAENALHQLLNKKWIALYKTTAFSQANARREFTEIPFTEIKEVLANPVSWYPEYAGVTIVFASTELGDAVYFLPENQTLN